jgi:hypothetical protein
MKRFNRQNARLAVLSLPLLASGVGLGCLGQVERTYFDDRLDASVDGTTVTVVDGSTEPDGTVAIDGDVLADDAGDGGVDAEGADVAVPDSGAPIEAGPPVEAGCGLTDTITNCGACGTACDTTHSAPSGCSGGTSCTYSSCTPGWGDCDAGAPDLNGCETPLDTAAHCGGCGVACDTTHSIDAGCTSGTTCTYQACQPGWSMCNTTAPNTAGCACNTPSCCGSKCQVTHTNGAIPTADSFYDCVDAGTYNATQAFEACVAYTNDATKCSTGWTCHTGTAACNSPGDTASCTLCWYYSGPQTGKHTTCDCPTSPSLPPVINSWN